MKKLFEKYREIILYLIFGVLTTIVAWGGYFLILWLLGAAFSVDEASAAMQVIRVVANVISWAMGVIFAFYTNKIFVFEDKNNEAKHVWRKLIEFSSSRLVTLILEIVVVWATVELLKLFKYQAFVLPLIVMDLTVTMDLIAKGIAAVLVIIGNYILSKLFVFNKKR